MTKSDREPLFSLAAFQQRAMEALSATIDRVSRYHEENPESRAEVALKSGVMLLQSPTGSGKTLILGRLLEGLRGRFRNKLVWFWFAPYSGLVAQTREALASQCSSLRLHNIYTDRETSGVRDGDVFIQTWAAVVARNSESRKVRRTSERALSLDDMLEDLRGDGFQIGVVIDKRI